MNILIAIVVCLAVNLMLYLLFFKRYPIRKLIKKSRWDYYLVFSLNDLNDNLSFKTFLFLAYYLKIKRLINYNSSNRAFNWLFTELKENESEIYYQCHKISQLDFNDLEKRKLFLKKTIETLCGIDGFEKH